MEKIHKNEFIQTFSKPEPEYKPKDIREAMFLKALEAIEKSIKKSEKCTLI